ncbi:MAG: hypothetical protein B7Z47_02935, partial [Chthoniobacter sp. 12-60-6]
RVHDCSFANVGEIAQPAVLTLSYDVPGSLHDEGGLQRATLPALWENYYLDTTFVKNRQTSFRMRYPFRLRSEVVIQKVHGGTPASLQALNQSSDGAFSRWKLATTREQNEFVVRFEFDSTTGEHPAASYSKWHDEWNAALKAWDHSLVWKR